MKQDKRKNKKGFTLIEMLVVVLIIGILAGIALPQYQMAVTKAKVASIMPLMRRWYDALAEYKLQNGSYEVDDYSTVDASWPSDWNHRECADSYNNCNNDYWDCMANEEGTGYVYCRHEIDTRNYFFITMYQPDEANYEDVVGMMTCEACGDEGNKVCKALGGKLLEGATGNVVDAIVYKLN